MMSAATIFELLLFLPTLLTKQEGIKFLVFCLVLRISPEILLEVVISRFKRRVTKDLRLFEAILFVPALLLVYIVSFLCSIFTMLKTQAELTVRRSESMAEPMARSRIWTRKWNRWRRKATCLVADYTKIVWT